MLVGQLAAAHIAGEHGANSLRSARGGVIRKTWNAEIFDIPTFLSDLIGGDQRVRSVIAERETILRQRISNFAYKNQGGGGNNTLCTTLIKSQA